jgi:hypothetical protein
VGGCLEYLSLVIGYRNLLIIAAAVYVLAFLVRPREPVVAGPVQSSAIDERSLV